MKKLSAIILTAIIAVSALSLAASAYAMPSMNWKNFQNMSGNAHRLATQQSSARIGGVITGWGDSNVTGTIQAFSQTVVVNNTDVRQGSSATAIWTTNQSRPISALQTKENFT
jgi:polyisoprenoid-binding protein YceI